MYFIICILVAGIGICINNLSSKYNWDIDYGGSSNQYEENLSKIISLGYSRVGEKFIIANQIDILDSEYRGRLGMEFSIYSKYKIRLGFNKQDNKLLYSLGFGIPFKIDDATIMHFDYALDPGLMEEGC